MQRYWLIFAQTVTVALGLLFIILTFRPHWVTGSSVDADLKGADRHEDMLLARTQANATNGLPNGYLAALQRASRSVVSIEAVPLQNTAAQALSEQLQHDPSFNALLDRPPGAQEFTPATNVGTGIIFNAEGYILTNQHVVEGARALKVSLADGRVFNAQVQAVDPESDLAVLRIAATKLPVIPLMPRTAPLQVGELVFAVGYPFGFAQTTTMGIVSGINRNQLGVSVFEDFIQTDAAIHPGNSGGPLLNPMGELVGVNTAIYSENGASLGIGFAIPAHEAWAIAHALMEQGYVTRGWLGIEPQDIWPLAQAATESEGVVVARVLKGGPAAVAGLEVGDVIVRLGDAPVKNTADLLRQVAQVPPDTRINMTVVRGNKPRTIAVTIQARPRPR